MMNKYQEAYLKLLSIFNAMQLGIYEHSTLEVAELFDTIQELVDKETPMKVDKNTKGSFPNYDKDDKDDTYHTTYKCPKCNCTIHLDWHEKRNYCPECAVKLDWSDTDE